MHLLRIYTIFYYNNNKNNNNGDADNGTNRALKVRGTEQAPFLYMYSLVTWTKGEKKERERAEKVSTL